MLKRSIILAGSTGVSQILVAFLYVIVARHSGPSLLGPVVSTIAVSTFLAGTIDFGSNTLWIRESVGKRYSTAVLYGKIVSKIAYVFAGSIAVTLFTTMLWPGSPFCYVGALVFSIVYYQSSTVPLKSAGAVSRLSAITLTERVLAVTAFPLLHLSGLPAEICLILAICAGSLGAGTASFAVAPSQHRYTRAASPVWWPWRGTMAYGLGGITISAQMLDTVIVHSIAGPAAAGVYGAVNRWTQPLSVFASAFSTVGLPVVARTGSLRQSFKELKFSWFFLAIAGILCIGVAIGSPYLVRLILGPQYIDSADVLALLAIGTIAALFNQPLYVFLQAMHLEVQSAIAVSVLVILQLALCALLSTYWAENGAATAFAVFQFTLLASFMFILLRRQKGHSQRMHQEVEESTSVKVEIS